MKPSSVDETAHLEFDDSEKAMTACPNPKAICYDSESSVEAKFETCKCNNNIGDCDISVRNGEIKVFCACLKENRQNNGNISVENSLELHKTRRPKKRKSFRKSNKKKNDFKEVFQTVNPIKGENKCSEISSAHNLSTVGGDGEEKRCERLRCRQHELNSSSNEINRPDVIMSCDLTSNSVIKFKSECCEKESNENKKVNKDCPKSRVSSCSVFQSTCSEGSYSRRKHHKHHKHKKRNSSPVNSEENTTISPKVNPIFLWVRQEDTKIVEVLCEDYDHRNRLRLTRTHLGWRAIPKTKRFAEAVIPKAVPKEDDNDAKASERPKHISKSNKKKKGKKKREPKILESDNPNQIKECSVALFRDDLADYKRNALISNLVENDLFNENINAPEESENNQSQSNSSLELEPDSVKPLSKTKRLTKSHSCVFSSFRKTPKSLPRSISLDLKIERSDVDFKVQSRMQDEIESDIAINESEEIADGIKSETAVEKEVLTSREISIDEVSSVASNLEKSESQRNHSESAVLDMTKHDLDFNDTDCDELGQLLKDIPDLEFVEEEELEEIDEEEQWLKPTDLTVQKSVAKNEISGIKLPASITPIVTVTTSTKHSEPLAAPLPEVTITPIMKPKPAHQQTPQNNFLESLLSSSRSVKPEKFEANMTQKKQGKPFKLSQWERKALKHFQENDFDCEIRNKKLKMEDITLRNLLSKQHSGRMFQPKSMEACAQKLKVKEGEECSSSRLQELLTDTASSDPIMQLKEVLSNPLLSVPDPLLVPRARLPALVASPASEIPRLLSMHLEKTVEETPCPPITDSDILEVSLSNLQSLLSCTPDKLKNANTQDLAKYQKTLETFLEWQRYQSQLMETQIKNSKSMLSGYPGEISDVAAATAFSQMLWLPYLNQFDLNCGPNRDFTSVTNPVLLNDYSTNCSNLSAPPQINTSHVSQPSPFLTPTSPMEFESHLKTLAMWQEALMMQQSSQFSRVYSKVSSNHQDSRRGAKFSNFSHPGGNKKSMVDTNAHSPRGTAIPPISSRSDPEHNNSHLDFEIFQDPQGFQNDYYKKQNRQNCLQQRLEQQNQLELQNRCKSEIQNQFRKMHQNLSNYQTELLKQCKPNEKGQTKKSGLNSGCLSVKPLANLIDKNGLSVDSKSPWEQSESDMKANLDFTSQVASKLQQFNTQIQRTTRKDKPVAEKSTTNPTRTSDDSGLAEAKPCVMETPKLKVKNLVDPNKSPPKLLKRIAPEHLPIVMNKAAMQDDGQASLWHPLFGSNQMKLPSYHSPWRWTTVTVNGE